MTPRIVPALLLCLLVLPAAVPAGVAAQSQNERPPEGDGPYQRDPDAQEAIDRLKSPYCPGLMLEVCPSAGGAALRDTLDMLADQGLDADSIVGWVLARYGQEWLAVPEPRGTGLLAWVVPGLGVLVGLGLVVAALGRMRRARGPGEVEERELTLDDEERLREALRELEAEEQAPL